MLSGSVALSVYTLPRATRDFDLVVQLEEKDIPQLLAFFQPGYYIEEESIREAVKRKGIFNIIDHQSGFKADFVILKDEPYRRMEFSRRQITDFYGSPVFLVSAEDLLLSKLIWIQGLQNNLQKEDILNLAVLENLDWHYINYWIKELQLNTFDLFSKKNGHS
jgi:hypothetical protein